MKPQYRLRASADIISTLKGGLSTRLPYCVIYVLQKDRAQVSRYTCIVGKKVSSSAVVRHAVQRRLRSAMSRIVLSRQHGIDMVIVAKSSVVLSMDFESLVMDLYYGTF